MGRLRWAVKKDGHKTANLYNAIDNLIASAKERLAAEPDQHTHLSAALRGRILGYREVRQLLVQSRRFRPRLLGDPPFLPPDPEPVAGQVAYDVTAPSKLVDALPCNCSCHTLPGVAHLVACCDRPPYQPDATTTGPDGTYALPRSTGHDPFGARVLDGGEPGTVVRCPECGGSGRLHKLDKIPEPVEPTRDLPTNGLEPGDGCDEHCGTGEFFGKHCPTAPHGDYHDVMGRR